MSKATDSIKRTLRALSNMLDRGESPTHSSEAMVQSASDIADNLFTRKQLENVFDIGFKYHIDLEKNMTKLSPMEYLDENLNL